MSPYGITRYGIVKYIRLPLWARKYPSLFSALSKSDELCTSDGESHRLCFSVYQGDTDN